jgi:hypothetical protein
MQSVFFLKKLFILYSLLDSTNFMDFLFNNNDGMQSKFKFIFLQSIFYTLKHYKLISIILDSSGSSNNLSKY